MCTQYTLTLYSFAAAVTYSSMQCGTANAVQFHELCEE
jgi:hypothetical protein